MLQKRQSCSN